MAKLATLGEIGERALQDEAFFKSLLADTRGTLQSAGLDLSESDKRRLIRMLTTREARVLIDPVAWFRRYHARKPGRKCLDFLDRLTWR